MWNKILNFIKEEINPFINKKIIPFIKKYSILVSVACLAILLLVGYFVGNINKEKDNLINNLEVALKNQDIKELRKVVRINNKKVDLESLKPLINYYGNDSSKIDLTISNLRNSNESKDFILETKSGLFGDKYILNLKLLKLKVISNFQEGKFTINDKDVISSDGTLSNIIPGIYTLKGVLYSEYGNIEDSKEIVIMENKTENFTFDAINIIVDSEYTDGEIFINDENTGYLVRDKEEIGPIKSDGSVKVHLEKEFPWGRISGSEIAVKDIKNVNVTINMNNEELQNNLKEKVENFYSSVFEALNQENKELITDATKETKDKIYGILEKNYFILKNKYSIDEIIIENEKNEFSYEDGIYRANIVVNLKYDISKKFLGINRTINQKDFFTKLIYKDSNWIVEDVENFNL
ncbi:MAG: hypothetical protein GX275_07425 [Clostridiales bacterium]|nr:hypothetical protein [Clostridiales bacterium]